MCTQVVKVQLLLPTESSPDDMQSFGSLLLDLSTLRTATYDFSEHKRLGEGGFGVVYKVTLKSYVAELFLSS